MLRGARGGAAPQDAQTLPERLREALEALGPTFVKFGQILATRSDLLDPAWTDELDRLHSQAAVLPWETLAPQIIADLGGEPEQRFAGSIARRWPRRRWRKSTARACTAANR